MRIDLPVVGATTGEFLDYQSALDSPCMSCPTSPCCTYLPVHKFKVETLTDVDHAVYLLNFDRIELGLSQSGEWGVYYRAACRFLDPNNFGCTIHDTPRQPHICVQYNPYHCWYKRVLGSSFTDEYLRIDRGRLEFVLSRVVFDEHRNIVEVPTWETLVEAFQSLPLAEPASRNIVEDPTPLPAFAETLEELPLLDDGSPVLRDPCAGCAAYCCTTLVFPHPTPVDLSGLDYLKFCLGFPGVEVGVSDGAWSIVLRTTCRHLQDHRCSVFGRKERPLICKYYDAWTCSYKPQFGEQPTPGFLRVRLDDFDALVGSIAFHPGGEIAALPSVDELRQRVRPRMG